MSETQKNQSESSSDEDTYSVTVVAEGMKAVVRTNFDDSVSTYDAYEQRTGRFTALTKTLAAELSASLRRVFAFQ